MILDPGKAEMNRVIQISAIEIRQTCADDGGHDLITSRIEERDRGRKLRMRIARESRFGRPRTTEVDHRASTDDRHLAHDQSFSELAIMQERNELFVANPFAIGTVGQREQNDDQTRALSRLPRVST